MTFSFPIDVPVLSDGEVTLRAHSPLDIERMHQMCRDPETIRWTTVPDPYSLEDAYSFLGAVQDGWERHDHRGWAIDVADNDGGPRYAGNVDVRGQPVATLGFALHPDARGRGVMARAVDLAVEWSLAHGGVDAIHWTANVGNVRSLRVAHEAGFRLGARVPRLLDHRGVACDAWTAYRAFGEPPGPRQTWFDQPQLMGDSVRLRPLAMSDAERIVESRTDAATRMWAGGRSRPYTLAEARDEVHDAVFGAARGSSLQWCVADRTSDSLLGIVGLSDLDRQGVPTAELSYVTHPDARGRGVAREAVALAVRHAFDSLGRMRLTVWSAVGNQPSNRVALGAGFALIGVEHSADLLGDGTLTDMNAYELVRHDWTAGRA